MGLLHDVLPYATGVDAGLRELVRELAIAALSGAGFSLLVGELAREAGHTALLLRLLSVLPSAALAYAVLCVLVSKQTGRAFVAAGSAFGVRKTSGATINNALFR